MNRLAKQAQFANMPNVDFTFTVNTASGWTLSAALAARGITKPRNITITIPAGIYVGSMVIDSAPGKSRVKLVVNGNLIGGINGGAALVVGYRCLVINRGMIAGGGGRGGNGGSGYHGGLSPQRACTRTVLGPGTGGNGAGMNGTVFNGAPSSGTAGASASDSAAKGGTGGAGGGLGLPGNAGAPGWAGNSWSGGTLPNENGEQVYYPACGQYDEGAYSAGNPGGAAGYSIIGLAKVTLDNKGQMLGPTAQ